MKKAIVIGATSGIGKELTRILSQDGYAIGIAGRRIHLLEKLQSELSTHIFLRQMEKDFSGSPRHKKQLCKFMK